MMVDTKNLVPMTEANQNFSRVVRMVDESGLAVILKNNKPRYIVVDFGEYEQIQTLRALRARQIGQEADRLLEENQEAFRGVGQMMLLTVEEILALQEKVISQTGGSFGLRDQGPPGVCRLQRGQFFWRCGGLPQPGGKGGEAGFLPLPGTMPLWMETSGSVCW